MDGFINSKIEAQTIYEIYRACRLCGAGAGYKMPIIQNVVDLDGTEVELKQKIRDCVQIEVHQDDKMPPLICELCVDKVNDFYEFLEMCRQTNKRTRLRLGLPPQTMPRGAPDAEDCILGITEPVFINDEDNEPLLKSRPTKNLKGNLKNIKNKNRENRVKIQLSSKRETKKDRFESRSLRSKQPSPPRLRGTKRVHEDDITLGSLQKSKRSAVPMPKSILKKTENDNNSYASSRLRGSRERERDTSRKESTNKKVQIVVKSTPSKSSQSKPNEYNCRICKAKYNNSRSYWNHMRVHADEKQPDRKQSKKSKQIECENCEKIFPNKHLLEEHSCSTLNCSTCGRKCSSRKSLSVHKYYCVLKKKATINPLWLRKVKPMQIRISRCDPLLEKSVNDHYNVSCVPFDYGLDKNCIYPYISRTLRIKSEPGYMVSINDDIKQAFDTDKYIHWDSEDTATDSEGEETRKVDSLTSLALKSIFSPKLLGKVPKKRRKVKAEKAFDSILNASDIDCDIRLGIDSIIDRLDDTVDANKNKSSDNDSLFGDDKSQSVTNDDFDALFGDNDKNNDKPVSNDDFDSIFGKDKNNDDNNDNGGDKSQETSDSVGLNSASDVNSESNVCSNNDNCTKVNDSDNVAVNDINNDVSKVNDKEERREFNECETNDDKNKVLTQENENNVLNDNCSEKSSLDLDKLNETDSKEMSDEDIRNHCNRENNDDKNDNNEVTNDNEKEENKETDDKEDIPDTLNEENKENDIDTKDSTDSKKDTDKIEKMETTKDDERVNGEELEEKFNMDDLEDVSDSEMDDKKLMDELDAQIGDESKV